MPYEGEFAKYKPLRRLVESDRVRELLGSYRVREKTHRHEALEHHLVKEFTPSEWIPDWVLAIDGSHAEVSVRNGFPGAEAAYVTVASVLIDLHKMRDLDQNRPVDPKLFRQTEQAESIDCALPGCNVISANATSAEHSFREALFKVMQGKRMLAEGETLLDTYEALADYKPTRARDQKCPYTDCPEAEPEYKRGSDQYQCDCTFARPLFSTDALRIHEGMQPAGSNGAMYAEVMQVFERVWMIHILRTLESLELLSVLRRLAIILDGPLAVFGHPAWLSQSISSELKRINSKVRKATSGQDLLILGIEKTGAFATHLNELDEHESGTQGRMPKQSLALIGDRYIKENIIFSDSTKPYGADTYFGRKFFYKTITGALIVATVPFLEDSHSDLSTAAPDQFPRLADAASVLDQLFCSRFPNALAPLVAAHAEAAIPLHLGSKVLEKLARDLIAEMKQ